MPADDVKELLAALETVRRQLKQSPVLTGTVVEVDLNHVDDEGNPTPVRMQIGSDDQALIWLPVKNIGMVPHVGATVDLLMNGADARIQARPGILVEGDLESSNFEQGRAGWRMTHDGVLECTDGIFRGIINASGGPQLLPNGDFEVDISGWTESAGTPSHETDTGETHLASAGALKLVTASESDERYVESDPVVIDPNDTLRADAFPSGSNALNRSRVAIVWRESDETEIEESVGEYVTVGTAYDRVVVQSAPPAVETGLTAFQPNEDVAFSGTGPPAGVPNDTVGQRYQNVNEVALDTGDYIDLAAGESVVHDWRANIGSGNLAGKTVTSVDVQVTAVRAGAATATVGAALLLDGVEHALASQPISALGLPHHTFRWDTNPETGNPWTIADVEALDTTDFARVTASTIGGLARLIMYSVVVRWQEDLPVPTKASVRVYLDPEQVAVTTWRVDDVELRTVSSVTAAQHRTAESGRRWEGDSVDGAQHRYYNDDDELIGTVDAHTSHGELAYYEMPDQASDQTGVTSSSTTIITTGGVATEITFTLDAARVVEIVGSAMLYKGGADTAANTVLEIRDGSNVLKKQVNNHVPTGGQITPTVRERVELAAGTYTRRLRFYTAASFINCFRTGAPEVTPWIKALDCGAPR